ncbi:flagellar basal body P-ring protein FlgI [Hydrogenophaga taeniospiralis]|uniref:flagellar basal body P-ring protein FlgI n=1 Tax=Hydrogenophaga taeniospiralis TaxID=65656 RepID=UPI001CFA272C|nr:flagellar basal body P-ring protein FlgI [Hydrogenophaga taeniospiralis]MCB4366784.1 flagellar basal body P-ring protein FlgI [Hydrogenophaga taeniospiralis]
MNTRSNTRARLAPTGPHRAALRRLLAWSALVLGVVALGWPAPAQAIRIKEIAAVQGVRSNQLTGFGLVVGLDGTGDQTTQMPYTAQGLNNYLQQLGLTLPADGKMQLKNVAAVLVTAQLPAFAQPGQMIDVTVSSVGNAKSLRGGTLITTPLKGADGEIYALAQGNLLVGGAGAAAGGSKVQINHLSAGRIPSGAQVERSVPTPFALGNTIDLGLNSADFLTARRVAEAVNARMGAGTASAVDGRVVRLIAPANTDARVSFLAEVEELQLEATVPAARVIINTRTGSIVMNQAVTLGPCAVAHGNLSVSISATPVISQPNPLSTGGQTVVTEKTDIQITQDNGSLIEMNAAPQLSDLVRMLNGLGATPQDLLAILQAIKAAGAMNAELEVI